MIKYKNYILSLAAFLGALAAISQSDYRPAMAGELREHKGEFQAFVCVSKREQLHNAYARRDDYQKMGEPIPSWLQQQIAELEQYIAANC